MYVIIGATGHTGRIITKRLLESGKDVRIISRDHEKAKELVALGAELHIGSPSDVALLKRTFKGATAVYAMVPSNFQAEDYTRFQMEHVNAIAEALKHCKVKYLVSLSSLGAQQHKGSGVVLGLHKMEKAFNRIKGLNTLHLRPGYFMENTLAQAGLLKQSGAIGTPIRGDIKMYLIATKDIGEYGAKRLIALDFEGHNHQDLLGQRDINFNEVASILGGVTGNPDTPYIQFKYDDFKKAMMESWGATVSAADNMNEFLQMINEGRADFPERTPESTTPTTIEEFAKTFKFVFDNL